MTATIFFHPELSRLPVIIANFHNEPNNTAAGRYSERPTIDLAETVNKWLIAPAVFFLLISLI